MKHRASTSRRRTQGGQEIFEFALTAFLLVPALMGSFITGMNLLITIQAKNAVRDLANMYIHGTDFSTYASQQLAQRLAKGLNLSLATSFTGNQQSSMTTSGRGVIIVTQLMKVGAIGSPNCSAVPSGHTCNANSFVFLQRVVFGSSTVYAAHPSSVGTYTDTGGTDCSAISSMGAVANPTYNTCAALASAAQSVMTSAWTGNANQTALIDGQVIYMVEGFFDTSSFSLGSLGSSGVYAKYFF